VNSNVHLKNHKQIKRRHTSSPRAAANEEDVNGARSVRSYGPRLLDKTM
jgi:hypothetical protein